MRLILLIVGIFAIAAGACKTAGSSKDVSELPAQSVTPVNSSTPQHDTYWVIGAITLIGTPYLSDVIQLPTDDKEAVAAAANAWGRPHGRMTGRNAVYPFSSAAEAQKFKDQKGELLLEITRDDLIPRLCVGAPEAGTGYWVISIKTEHLPEIPPGWDSNTTYFGKATYTHSISSPLLLSEHSDKAIYWAVGNWNRGSVDEANTRKFASLSDAEAFVANSGMEHLDLTAETLNKYLCAIRPEESQPTPKPRTKH